MSRPEVGSKSRRFGDRRRRAVWRQPCPGQEERASEADEGQLGALRAEGSSGGRCGSLHGT